MFKSPLQRTRKFKICLCFTNVLLFYTPALIDCGHKVFILSVYLHKTLTLHSIDTQFGASTQAAFENIVGKGEIAFNNQINVIVSLFVHIFDISLFAAELEEPKIGILDKGLASAITSEK